MYRGLIFIGLSLVSQTVVALTYTHLITEQAIQEKVAALMPIKKKKYFITIKISSPQIDLIKETDEIGILAHIEAKALGGIKGKGEVRIKGTVEYVPEQGEFYFKDPTIVSLVIDNVSAAIMPKIQGIAQASLSKAMAVYPIYKFKDNNVKHRLAKAVLKSLTVENEQLLLTLDVF